MNPAIKFIHLRLPATTTGGVTVAYRVHNGRVKQTSIAKCHKDDHYNKKVGAELAKSRLMSGDYSPVLLNSMLEPVFIRSVHDTWESDYKNIYRSVLV